MAALYKGCQAIMAEKELQVLTMVNQLANYLFVEALKWKPIDARRACRGSLQINACLVAEPSRFSTG